MVVASTTNEYRPAYELRPLMRSVEGGLVIYSRQTHGDLPITDEETPHANTTNTALVEPSTQHDIQAVILPSRVHISYIDQERIRAHSNAFPFAAPHRAFLARIQKKWLQYWSNFIKEHNITSLSAAQKRFPLMRISRGEVPAVPYFGWVFIKQKVIRAHVKCAVMNILVKCIHCITQI